MYFPPSPTPQPHLTPLGCHQADLRFNYLSLLSAMEKWLINAKSKPWYLCPPIQRHLLIPMLTLVPLTTALGWVVLLAQVIPGLCLTTTAGMRRWKGEDWWVVFLTRSDCPWQWQKTDTCGCNMYTHSMPFISPMLYAPVEAGHHGCESYSTLGPVLFLCSPSPGHPVEPYSAFWPFQKVSGILRASPVAPFLSLLACQP